MGKLSMKLTPQLAGMGPLPQGRYHQYANAIFTNNFCHMVKLSMKLAPEVAGTGPLTQATFHQYTCHGHRTGRVEAGELSGPCIALRLGYVHKQHSSPTSDIVPMTTSWAAAATELGSLNVAFRMHSLKQCIEEVMNGKRYIHGSYQFSLHHR